ncbi:ENR1 protein, partial [Oxyruncus cristatus]|nr:ENR1 protein [Oxyruncus cristatus]
IIWLQAVVIIVINQTATGLQLIAEQQLQSRAVINQNRLDLDYLLAEGVCGKF